MTPVDWLVVFFGCLFICGVLLAAAVFALASREGYFAIVYLWLLGVVAMIGVKAFDGAGAAQ